MKPHALFAVLLLGGPAAYACLHAPAAYKGSHEETAQEAIVFWNDGREELVIKVAYRLKPEDPSKLPDSLAWVIPTPAVPDAYSVEKPKIFQEIFDAWEGRMPKAGEKDTEGNEPKKGEKSLPIEFFEKVSVGEFEIQPVKAHGDEGAKALNDWLDSNGFGKVPEADLKHYVDRGWVWLAVKASLGHEEKKAEGKKAAGGEAPKEKVRWRKKADGAEGTLHPLRISFASKEIVFPLKFSSHQGTFDVNLYVVTEEVPDFSGGNSLAEFHFTAYTIKDFALPKGVKEVEEKAAKEGKYTAIEKPCVTKITGRQVNDPKNQIAKWTKDFSIAMGEGERPSSPAPSAPVPPKPLAPEAKEASPKAPAEPDTR